MFDYSMHSHSHIAHIKISAMQGSFFSFLFIIIICYMNVAKRWRKIAAFSIYNYDETKNSLQTGAELMLRAHDMVYDIKTLHCSLQSFFSLPLFTWFCAFAAFVVVAVGFFRFCLHSFSRFRSFRFFLFAFVICILVCAHCSQNPL